MGSTFLINRFDTNLKYRKAIKTIPMKKTIKTAILNRFS